MRFRAESKSNGKTAAGFEVPDQIVVVSRRGGRPKVKVTIDGYEFRTSIARMGDRYLLGVSNERRAEAGIAAGDTLDVEVELDTAERRVEIPVDPPRRGRGAGSQGVFESLSSPQQSHTVQVDLGQSPGQQAETVAMSVQCSQPRTLTPRLQAG